MYSGEPDKDAVFETKKMKEEGSRKEQLLEQTKAAREERALEKRRHKAAISIQALCRGFISRRRTAKSIRDDVDKKLEAINFDSSSPSVTVPVLETYLTTRKLFLFFDPVVDAARFLKIIKYVVISMAEESLKSSYISIGLNKDHAVSWIAHVKKLAVHSSNYLKTLRTDQPDDNKAATTYVHMLLTFTGIETWRAVSKLGDSMKSSLNKLCSSVMREVVNKGLYSNLQGFLWNGLVRNKPCLRPITISAVLKLALRPLKASDFSDPLMSLFLIHLISIPAVLYQVDVLVPESFSVLKTEDILKRTIKFLNRRENCDTVIEALEVDHALCFIANIIQLSYSEREKLHTDINFLLDYNKAVTELMAGVGKYVGGKQSSLTHWHPILGWFAESVNLNLQEVIGTIRIQLGYLWRPSMVRVIFSPLFSIEGIPSKENLGDVRAFSGRDDRTGTSVAKFFKRALEKTQTTMNMTNNYLEKKKAGKKLGSTEMAAVCRVGALYHTSICTLTQLRLDILTGLSFEEGILPGIWRFLQSLNHGLKGFIEFISLHSQADSFEAQLLVLFCSCMVHLITTLDDIELYEHQVPFTLPDLVLLSGFLNNLVFKLIWGEVIDLKTLGSSSLFESTYSLLELLYQRDCRRSFTPTNHWLVKDVKSWHILRDLDNGKKNAKVVLSKIPWVIPLSERVSLFRNHVSNEKATLGIDDFPMNPMTGCIVIHVRRGRIVEDGYRQLSDFPASALKRIIRVRFINIQGLSEAGIDQDGVFKEFLEETIKEVFDPRLNLFKLTADERIYPSPTSHLQDNHLHLFEYVGKVLGKAVYEGIVVDVPFASFFLSQLLGHKNSAFYSYLDELPSLDPDLYKNLTFIKHYDGEVSDMDLTFSLDQDVLGKLVTYELVPGGKAINVTCDNKIQYIHLMAHFRMYSQLKEQTTAFFRGFREIIKPDWLSFFSTPELQWLISGDCGSIDLDDLRRNTQYFGGFHDNHPVICWLWETLRKDFKEPEKGMFLKFVTSCSKPPLLGFSHLDPPFSIRCVEVSADEDTGDTVWSVLRGFLAIRKKESNERLPTSSTCFNLLKLPNYRKKSILREKLRLAITSNTGFELS